MVYAFLSNNSVDVTLPLSFQAFPKHPLSHPQLPPYPLIAYLETLVVL